MLAGTSFAQSQPDRVRVCTPSSGATTPAQPEIVTVFSVQSMQVDGHSPDGEGLKEALGEALIELGLALALSETDKDDADALREALIELGLALTLAEADRDDGEGLPLGHGLAETLVDPDAEGLRLSHGLGDGLGDGDGLTSSTA